MSVDVWIPDTTTAEERALLGGDAVIHDWPREGQLPDHLGHGEILVAGFDRARMLQVIDRIDGLRVVQTFSAGVDYLVDALPAGVTLCDAAGVHDASVADWVMAVLLAMRRRLALYLDAQQRREWLRIGASEAGADLEDATVVIVGYGSIGRALEARLLPFGTQVLRVARHRREGVAGPDELPSLLARADCVVVLLPLTPETRGFVDSAFLASMKPGALLVNAARGAVVDTDALLAALRGERIRAALDVTDPEPLPPDHPLWAAPGVLITPHVAGTVPKMRNRAWRLIAEQVRRYAAGEPLLNVVSEGY